MNFPSASIIHWNETIYWRERKEHTSEYSPTIWSFIDMLSNHLHWSTEMYSKSVIFFKSSPEIRMRK